MASRYMVLEYRKYDTVNSAFDGGFSDTYEAGNTLLEAVEKMAYVRDTYSNYNHILIEVIPVTIESVSGSGDTVSAVDGDVRVSVSRNRD